MKRFLAFFILSSLVFPLCHAADGAALLSKMEGEVIVMRQNQPVKPKPGEPLQENDVIQTQKGGYADVIVNGVAGCRILENSELSVSRTAQSDMHLKIMLGNAVLNLAKLPENSQFKVETPTAVATVRGTQFWGRVQMRQPENPVTTFAVREGSVDVFAKTGQRNFTIEAGQALDIPNDAAVPVVRPALEAELKAMEIADAINLSA